MEEALVEMLSNMMEISKGMTTTKVLSRAATINQPKLKYCTRHDNCPHKTDRCRVLKLNLPFKTDSQK